MGYRDENKGNRHKIQKFKNSKIQDSMIQIQIFDMRCQEWIKKYQKMNIKY